MSKGTQSEDTVRIHGIEVPRPSPIRRDLEDIVEHEDFLSHDAFKTVTVGSGPFTIGATIMMHGNEDVGWYVREYFKQYRGVELDKAQIKFIFADPRAFVVNQRLAGKNLNRMGDASDSNGSYEQQRMAFIIKELADVDVHIDFHSTTEIIDPHVIHHLHEPMPSNQQLIRNNYNLAKTTGLTRSFVYHSGFVGTPLLSELRIPSIAIECGSHKHDSTYEKGVGMLKDIINHYQHNSSTWSNHNSAQEHYIIDGGIEYQKGFFSEKDVRDFREVQPGTVLARRKYGFPGWSGKMTKKYGIPGFRVIRAEDTFYPLHVDYDDPSSKKVPDHDFLFMLKTYRADFNPKTFQYVRRKPANI